MDFKVQLNSGKIGINFDELMENAKGFIVAYENYEVKEEEIKQAKEDRAMLNKLVKEIDTRRLAIKKEYMKPLEEFENKCKELKGLLLQPIGTIDNGLLEHEEKRIKAKKQEVIQVINELVDTCDNVKIKTLLNRDLLVKDEYTNKVVTLSKIKKEVQEQINIIKTNLFTISMADADIIEEITEDYLQTLDINKATKEMMLYASHKERALAKAREEQIEQEIKKRELQRENESLKSELVDTKETVNKILETFEVKECVGETKQYTIQVECSNEELGQVELYMNSLGLIYTVK